MNRPSRAAATRPAPARRAPRLVGVLAIAGVSLPLLAQPALTGCASETPPFVLMHGGIGQGGFTVELFRDVATQLRRVASVREMPWSRCLAEVKAGRVDVALDAYDDADRRRLYHYSQPYHQLTPQVFHPAGAPGHPAPTAAALQALRGCGVRGYTYEHYELPTERLDLEAGGDRQMISKLVAGRCDYAIEELEFIVGGRKYVAGWPDERGLQSYRPAWAAAPRLHFLVGKGHPEGADLMARIDAAIEAADRSGQVERLRALHLRPASSGAAASPRR